MGNILVAAWLVALAGAPGIALAQTAAAGSIRGIVLDRTDGSPIADVTVRVQDTKQDVKTGPDGRFEFSSVEPGRRTIYVSTVGFILVKRAVDLPPGGALDLTIALTEGTGTYAETVTVTASAGKFQEQEKSVPAQQTLGSADIQNLRSLLTNDPMRAIQVLPGVTTGDDFRSEFAVRGSGFNRMTFTFDGIPASFLLHTIQQVLDGGSIAMVNGDILDGITLMNGSYPQRYGNRVGAELDFHMREGSRDRTQVRLGVSGTDASVVAEGPLGGTKAGAWLFSARKSYLEMLLRQIDSTSDFGFGFSDVQGKLVYDASSRSKLELSLVAGRSRLEQPNEPDEVFSVADGRNQAQLVNAAWRFTASPGLVVTNRLGFAANQSRNTNVSGFEFHRGRGHDLTWRSDFVARLSSALSLEGGGQIQRQQRALVATVLVDPPASGQTVESYDTHGVLASAYVQTPWSPASRIRISPGVRFDRWSLTGEAAASPWVQAEAPLGAGLTLRAGAGIHRQFPGFDEAAGLSAAADPRPERAYHADVGVERALGSNARLQVTFYNREERGLFRVPGREPQLVDGDLVMPHLGMPWANALDGESRGVELLVQRRHQRGLTGWLSYAYGVNRYRDRTTGESFDGDYDQRHTINAYALYRLNDRTTLGAKLRAGSNTPIVGYWTERNGAYFVSASRNQLRLPAYSRLDVRASRTFNWQATRMTLFVELLNVLGRDNVRFTPPFVDPRTGRAFGLFESMIPRVPSAGILLEF